VNRNENLKNFQISFQESNREIFIKTVVCNNFQTVQPIFAKCTPYDSAQQTKDGEIIKPAQNLIIGEKPANFLESSPTQ
jgi:hypothetical protein